MLTPEPALRSLDVVVEDGRITEVLEAGTPAPPAAAVLDAAGLIVSPGFIDVQINGGWGGDITTDPGAVTTIARCLPPTGVTAFCPTVLTAPASARRAALERIDEVSKVGPPAATVLGLHLEGPVINPARAGAHRVEMIPPRPPADSVEWSGANGVAMVTLAPERKGAMELISELVSQGVTVALGHTDADADVVAEAVRRGATMVTHLFNAMAPFTHRRPGPVGAVLDCDALTASLVCDGIHLHPTAVSIAWRILGVERAIMISDATAALGGSGPESVTLAGRPVDVTGNAVLTADGSLAGSVLTLDRAVRNLVAFTSCSAAEALHTATANPARVLGLADRGRIEPGAAADLVLLTPDLHVVDVLVAGSHLESALSELEPSPTTGESKPLHRRAPDTR